MTAYYVSETGAAVLFLALACTVMALIAMILANRNEPPE